MKLRLENIKDRAVTAFTLVEVLIATGILGIMIVSFYGGIAGGFAIINLSRENLRANQIVLEKMETIRLYSWDQINSNGYIPATFTAPFYPAAGSSTQTAGITYYGSLTISNAPLAAAYSNNLKLVRVSVVWTNGKVPRTREMETLVSEFGIQNYVY